MTENELTLHALDARMGRLERQMTELQRQYEQDKKLAQFSEQLRREGIQQVVLRTIIFALVIAGTTIGALSVLFPFPSRYSGFQVRATCAV